MATARHREDSARNNFLKVLAEPDVAEFVRLFAPATPIRAAEFKRLLASLIERQCIAREDAAKSGSAVATAKKLGRRGGLVGGDARARSLSADQRKELARRAALSRWHNNNPVRLEAIRFIEQFIKDKGRSPSRRAIVKHFKVSTSTATRWLQAAAS